MISLSMITALLMQLCIGVFLYFRKGVKMNIAKSYYSGLAINELDSEISKIKEINQFLSLKEIESFFKMFDAILEHFKFCIRIELMEKQQKQFYQLNFNKILLDKLECSKFGKDSFTLFKEESLRRGFYNVNSVSYQHILKLKSHSDRNFER